MHFYRFFGLIFSSELGFPFLREIPETTADVIIQTGKTPEKLTDIKNHGVLYQTNDKEFLFWFNMTAKYYVKNGESIVIEKALNSSEKDIYAFFAGSVIGALLQQRSMLGIHACTVEKNGIAVSIAGKTGSGKSSLAYHMYKKGFNIVSDDVSVVKFDKEKNLIIENGPPYFKLWYDVLKQNNENVNNFNTLRDNIRKYIFPFDQKTGKHYLHSVFILKSTNNNEFKINEIFGAEKFEKLRRNIYKPQFIKNTKFEQTSFPLMSKVAQQCRIFEITQPINKYYTEKIEEEINKLIDA